MSRLRIAGNGGYSWPSTASSGINSDLIFGAYFLGFYAVGVNPSNGPDYRWDGFPLRCLDRRGMHQLAKLPLPKNLEDARRG